MPSSTAAKISRHQPEQQPVHHEAGRIFDQDGVLLQPFATSNAVARVSSSVAGPERSRPAADRHRVEEMETDEPLGMIKIGGHLCDGQRGGVGGEYAAGGDVLLKIGEDLLLDRHLFEDGLDDEVAVGEIDQLGGT